MSELLTGSLVADDALKSRIIPWPLNHPPIEPKIYCAYNKTHEQFLFARLKLADLSRDSLREQLAMLTPGCKTALWLSPFRGISPEQVESPIDLVFLDRNHFVIAVVENFPVYQPTSSCWPVGTALALPPQTVSSTGVLPGDQLVLCSPEKMKRRLSNLQTLVAGVQPQESISHNLYSVSLDLSRLRNAPAQLTTWEEILSQPRSAKPSANLPSDDAAQSSDPSVTAKKSPSVAQNVADDRKNWLLCLLPGHRRELRKSPREFLPWVAAYLFNDGVPAPASVRNISLSGMFVFTGERWYLGSVIRLTLTDWRLPSPDRSLIVNAMAVRWSDAGVGFRFVFQKPCSFTSLNISDAPLVDVTQKQLKAFLHQFRPSGLNSKLSWSRPFRPDA